MSSLRSKARDARIPPTDKDVITYRETQELGFCSERKLRELVTTGKVVRSVLRGLGRSVRFVRSELIEELRHGG